MATATATATAGRTEHIHLAHLLVHAGGPQVGDPCASQERGGVMAFDGKGPAVQWFPRFMRPWVNRFFASMGWPKPYDEDLNKIPRRDR